MTATTLSAFQQAGEAASLGQVTFDANTPASYEQQSGQSIGFNVDTSAGSQLDVVVIAWSDEEQRVVDAFAHTVTGSPWRIPTAQLDTLPLGRNNLQLMLRDNGRVIDRAYHWLEVEPPAPTPPSLTFDNGPATWQKEVDGAISLAVDGDVPDGADMLVLAWSDEQNQMVDGFAHTLEGDPWQISASQLNQLPEGRNNLQVVFRLPDMENLRAAHWVEIEAAPEPEPDPDDVVTIAFGGNAPDTYQIGSSGNIRISLSDDMPEGGEVMVLAWSDDQQRMVDEFAHRVTSNPWRIERSQLGQLPNGRVNLQLILRVPDAETQRADHWMTVSGADDDGGDGGNGDDGNGDDGNDDNGNGDDDGDTGNGDDGNGNDDDDDGDDNDNGNGDDNGDGGLTPPDPNHIDRSNNGWTQFPRANDSRVIYVSSSRGNDNNNGLSEDRPVRSLSRGYSLVRSGRGDHMLLRRGDRWTGNFPRLEKSGRSSEHRMVIGAYGEGRRPIVGNAGGSGNLFGMRPVTRHVAIVGLELDARGRNTGVRLVGEFHDFLIEDCHIWGASANITAHQFNGGRPSNFAVRRSVIADARPAGGNHSQGIYVGYIDGVLLEDNVLVNNGAAGTAQPTIFNHNVYTFQCHDITIRNNIFADPSSFGLKLSSNATGGSRRVLVEDNVFFGGANGMSAGYSGGNGYGSRHNFVDLTVRRNLITRIGRAITVGGNPQNQSFGIYISSVDRGRVESNYLVQKPFEAGHSPIQFYDDKPNRDVMVQSNVVFNWYWNEARHPAIRLGPGVEQRWNEVELAANRYVDPSREVSTYHGWIGRQATQGAFLEEARKQRREFWRPAYEAKSIIAYVREGYTQVANYD